MNKIFDTKGGRTPLDTRSIYAAPRSLFNLAEADKRKLESYYSHGKRIPSELRDKLRTVWSKEGEPGAGFGAWLNKDLKTRFSVTPIPRSRGKGGAARIRRMAEDDRALAGEPVDAEVGSTMGPLHMMLTKDIGKDQAALPPAWPDGLTLLAGAEAVMSVVTSYAGGQPIDEDTQEFLESIAERHPEWSETINETISGTP